jgi:hypothetical protein
MEINQSKSHLKPVVQQVTNNTTSWIGHRHGETKSRFGGQTFTCPSEGNLDAIEVVLTHITNNGPVDLTIHSFDSENKTWGAELGTSTVEFNKSDTGNWVSFPLKGIKLEKGKTYGFRLKCEAGLIGIGEAAGSNGHLPFADGQEWNGTSDNKLGNFFTYLSLAFKVALRA